MRKTVPFDTVDGTNLSVVMKLASCWLGSVMVPRTVEMVQMRRSAPSGN